jgi:hypothetical protein
MNPQLPQPIIREPAVIPPIDSTAAKTLPPEGAEVNGDRIPVNGRFRLILPGDITCPLGCCRTSG